MGDFRLKYTGEEVNQSITDSKKITDIYNSLSKHLQGHVTNEAKGIYVSGGKPIFRADNVEDILIMMEQEYNQYIKMANSSITDLENQVVLSNSEIDTIIANAIK